MALNKRYTYVWHVGETATPFPAVFTNQDGSPFTQIVSAVFTLVNADTGATLVDEGPCQSVANGVLLYFPAAGELSVACRFRAQFVATLSGGSTLPSPHYDGEIEATL